MRVLVTGASGFIGSHTLRALVLAGHEVRPFVRSREKLRGFFQDLPEATVDIATGNMTSPIDVERALKGCDAVVHAAALVDLERAHAQRVLDTNLAGVELVVGGAQRAGIDRIVYVSSTAALFDPARGEITPDSPVAPQASSAYGLSKAQGELFVRGLQDAGACVKTVYPAGVIGPDDPELSEGNQGLRMMIPGPRVVSEGGLQCIDVRDLAAIHVALLEGAPKAGRYVAAGRFMTFDEISDLLDELTGRRAGRFRLPPWMLRAMGALGDVVKEYIPFGLPLTLEAMTYATQWPGADDSKTLAETGVTLRDPRETFADTLRWLYAEGLAEAAHVGPLADDLS
jgi:nucleoside-diphosphate-sugar epimerase